ncbi:hypothetical protein [Luteimonas panaciterrae]|uniref:hypothetical protein n=1 Tax=Luteimonas panaciterrae TaxID=363885 RepID=UPI001CFA22F6|nr:hypothetical protein [Luteimonas panaciterrae]
MKLTTVFAHAIVRRLAVVLVACVLGLIAQCAHAQYEGCLDPLSVNAFCQDEGMANLGANKVADRIISSNPSISLSKCAAVYSPSTNYSNATNIRIAIRTASGTCAQPFSSGNRAFPNTNMCAARQTRNSNLIKESDALSGSMCDNGCKAELVDISLDMSLSGPISPTEHYMKGTIKPTGQPCNDPNVPDEPMKCHQVNGGYQMCLKANKDLCVKTPRGKTYCWTPSNAGPQVGDDRKDGGVKSAPNTQPNPPQNREGEDWQEGGRGTVTDHQGGGVTVVTGVNNGGTPNTGTPVPGDGTGGGDGDGGTDGGDGDDEEGSASGGGDCTAPPTCSGDPIMCAVLDQQWRTRCGNNKGDENGNGRPDWTEPGEGEGDTPLEGDGTEKIKEFDFGIDMIDDSGFISADCPELPTWDLGPLGSFDLNTAWWCDMLATLGYVFLFIAACVSLAILVS